MVPTAVKVMRGKIKSAAAVGKTPVPAAKPTGDRKQYHKTYYQQNRPTILKRRKKYYAANRANRIAYQRKYNAQLRADAIAFRELAKKGQRPGANRGG